MKTIVLGALLATLISIPAFAENLAVEGYFGQRLNENYKYFDGASLNLAVNSGTYYGGSIWYTGLNEHVEIGIDINQSSALDVSGIPWDATAIMAVGRISHSFNSFFDVYAGAGLGLINTDVKNEFFGNPLLAADSATSFGGQFSIGARANISENISIFGEFKHQRVFRNISQITVNNLPFNYEYDANHIAVGLRIKLPAN